MLQLCNKDKSISCSLGLLTSIAISNTKLKSTDFHLDRSHRIYLPNRMVAVIMPKENRSMRGAAWLLFAVSFAYSLSFRKFVPRLNHHRSKASIPDDVDVKEEKLSTSSIIDQIFSVKQLDSNAKLGNLNNFGAEKLSSCQRPTSRSESWRYNNLFDFFSLPFERKKFSDKLISGTTKGQVNGVVSSACEQANYVFVDGRYAADLSSPMNSKGDNDFSFESIHNMDVETLAKSYDLLSFLPDSNELQRNSYSSDALTALNLVRSNLH